MQIQRELNKSKGFLNLQLLANQVVEGFISGIHKSPFHGFSAEFAEHKIYNTGESTKHIDWKLFAKTDKLYTKQYEEETNLRGHLIIDNSSSMHYPAIKNPDLENLNKISFSVLASAALMNLMKKQRDAVGLSIYSDQYEFYASEKSNERHHALLLSELNALLLQENINRETKSSVYLHQIAENLKRRSLVFLFTDMWKNAEEEKILFEALRHLKFKKHQVVLFHIIDRVKEINFDFDNAPKQFIDLETGEKINLFADNIKSNYRKAVEDYFTQLRLHCLKYKIRYVPADINQGFDKIMRTFLTESHHFK